VAFQVGLENNFEGRSLAWILGYPGCFAYGIDDAAALGSVPQAIREYNTWIEVHGESWLDATDIQIEQVETWQVYDIDDNFVRVDKGYSVNAWFLHDWKPLSEVDVQRGMMLLAWSRLDLLSVVEGLTPEFMDAERPGERWGILGILNHIGGAEWWYLDRLGYAFSRQNVPDDPFEKLEKVRSRLLEVLPDMLGSRQVSGVDGEFWSPRKLLRRAIWHERDHTAHILKLVTGPSSKTTANRAGPV